MTSSPDYLHDTPPADKWGAAVKKDYQVVPNQLFRSQTRLGLDAVDVVLVLNIALHWWRRNDLPFPRPAVLADRMGLTTRSVERRIRKLERAGVLRRLPREIQRGVSVRRFDLRGLADKLVELAAEAPVPRRPSAAAILED